VQAKEIKNVELKIIITDILVDGVCSITEWFKLLMGSCKAFFLQVQPNFITHLKLMWHLVLIMALFYLSLEFCRIS
jgi:glycyl-tRNA synthetase beta subunit